MSRTAWRAAGQLTIGHVLLILAGLGGDLVVDAHPGHGTTVRRRLPATARPPSDAPAAVLQDAVP